MITTIERDEVTVPTFHASPTAVLGTDVSDAADAYEVLAKANLTGWNVHLRDMETVSETITAAGVTSHPSRLRVPDQFAVIRTNPTSLEEEVIGTVGNRYQVMQNEEIADFLNELVGQTGGQITAAADYYRDGKQVFFTLDLPQSVLIGGRDLVDHNITIFTSHDGSTSVTPVISSVRAMCANMRNLVLRSGLESAKIRHTANLKSRLSAVQKTLNISFKEIAAFDAKAEKMINTRMSTSDFDDIIARVFPVDPMPSARGITMAAQRTTALKEVLAAPEQENIRFTAWAGYSAVTSYLQHSATGEDAARKNATRALTSTTVRNTAARAEAAFHAFASNN
jgi:phage/plasmid-like protein (TIGR03299 family)